MDKVIFASVKDNLLAWSEVLKSSYSLMFFEELEMIFPEMESFGSRLLVLDASLIHEMDDLSRLCQGIDKVLVVGEDINPSQQIQFIYEGAWGYSEKSIDEHLILRAVEGVLNNEIWLERQIIPQMLQGIVTRQQSGKTNEKIDNQPFRTLAVLTQREIEVIELLYDGEDNLAIAETLNITLRTVKAHLSAIFRKFNVQNRFQLVVFLKDVQMGHLSKRRYF